MTRDQRKPKYPEANTFWTDIGPADVVTDEGKLWVVTTPEGKRSVACWNGKEAREAQAWLRRRAMKDAWLRRGAMED
jgi:hypothetical protein